MTAPIRILFGDDDTETLEAVSAFLESRGGFEVIQVRTAADLYTAALADEPDIVISDFDYGFGRSDRFPDGVAIGVALREEGLVVPFVIYSGLHRRSARDAGFPVWLKDDIIDLPNKINDLVRGTDAP